MMSEQITGTYDEIVTSKSKIMLFFNSHNYFQINQGNNLSFD